MWTVHFLLCVWLQVDRPIRTIKHIFTLYQLPARPRSLGPPYNYTHQCQFSIACVSIDSNVPVNILPVYKELMRAWSKDCWKIDCESF